MSGFVAVNSAVVFAPAKINLFLAVTGRRTDGFHDLVSVVAPLAWGDTLWVESGERKAAGGKPEEKSGKQTADDGGRTAGGITLECDEACVPCDETKPHRKSGRGCFARRQAGASRCIFGWRNVSRWVRGSAEAAATAPRHCAGLTCWPVIRSRPPRSPRLAARVGSDCALFLHGVPVVMRGRANAWQRCRPPPPHGSAGVACWCVQTGFRDRHAVGLSAAGRRGAGGLCASGRSRGAVGGVAGRPTAPAEKLLGNNLERPAFAKFIALPALIGELRNRFALAPQLSGSGSACFAFLPDNAPVPEIAATIRAAWGEAAFVLATAIS